MHQPMAWLVPHACAQPYHPGSCSHGQLFHPYSRRVLERVNSRPDGYAMLMSHNKGETAVHGCNRPGDMAVRTREVLSRP